jgi:formamidopyrimidine-DNA glycosylase
MILMTCDSGLTLIVHLKMTGRLILGPERRPRDQHTRFVLRFKNRTDELRFRDVRKFGFVKCIRTKDLPALREIRELGPEPLDLPFSSFARIFKTRKGRLKSLLLNQKIVAGIGNIYADEILHRAHLHPLTPAGSLKEGNLKLLWISMRRVLREAIRHKGSSIRDFRDAEGAAGKFQNRHRVYGRESLACLSCGEAVRRIKLGGRSSYFCPACQIKPRPKDKQRARDRLKETEFIL